MTHGHLPPSLVGVDLKNLDRRWTDDETTGFSLGAVDPLRDGFVDAFRNLSNPGMPLSDFDDRAAVVLLAPAGGGKSAELWMWAQSVDARWIDAGLVDSRTTARTELEVFGEGDVVFVDGLDETPCTPRILLAELAALAARGVKVRLAARPSWWALWKSSVRPWDVTELTPLTLSIEQGRRLVANHVADADGFLKALRSHGLGWTLSSPRSLVHYAREFDEGRALSTSQVAVHRALVRRQLSEVRDQRAGQSDLATVDDIYSIATFAAAASLFERRPLLRAVAAENPLELNVRDLRADGLDIDYRTIDTEAILESALFASGPIEGSVRFVDRAIQEFLVAEYVSSRIPLCTDPDAVFNQLFTIWVGERQFLVPELRRVAAWVCEIEPVLFPALIAIEPEAIFEHEMQEIGSSAANSAVDFLLSSKDVATVRARGRDSAVQNLFRAADDPTEQLRHAIDEAVQHDRWWLLEIVGLSGFADAFIGELLDLALDQDLDDTYRYWALHALPDVVDDVAAGRLRKLLDFDVLSDADQRLYGMVLRRLWPKYLELEDVLALLIPRRSEALDAYWHFLNFGLRDGATPEQLPAILGFYTAKGRWLDPSGINSFESSTVDRMLEDIPSSEPPLRALYLECLATRFIASARNRASSRVPTLFPAGLLSQTEMQEVGRRILEAGFGSQLAGMMIAQLADRADCDELCAWLAQEFSANPLEPAREACAIALHMLVGVETEAVVPAVMAEPERPANIVDLERLLSDRTDAERWFHVWGLFRATTHPSMMLHTIERYLSDDALSTELVGCAAKDFVGAMHGRQLIADGHVNNFGLLLAMAYVWLSEREGAVVVEDEYILPVVRSAPYLSECSGWQRAVEVIALADPALLEDVILQHIEHVNLCASENRGELHLLAPAARPEFLIDLWTKVADSPPGQRVEYLSELGRIGERDSALWLTTARELLASDHEGASSLLRSAWGSEMFEPVLRLVLEHDGPASRNALADWAERYSHDDGTLDALPDERLANLFQELTHRFDRFEMRSGVQPPERYVDELRGSIIDELAGRGEDSVGALRTAAGENSDWEHVLSTDQRNAFLSNCWRPLSQADLVELLVNQRSQPISRPADLHLAVQAQLVMYQRSLQMSNGASEELRSESGGGWRPKEENRLSDHLVRFLRARTGFFVAREVEIRPQRQPERRGEEPDIMVALRTSHGEQLQCAIEVKKCVHRDWKTAYKDQLVDRYLDHTDVHCGLYVVFCFPDCDDPVDCQHETAETVRLYLDALQLTSEKPVSHFVIDGSL